MINGFTRFELDDARAFHERLNGLLLNRYASQYVRPSPQTSDRLGEAALFERGQQFSGRLRRVLQARSLTTRGVHHRVGKLVPKPRDECVRVRRLD